MYFRFSKISTISRYWFFSFSWKWHFSKVKNKHYFLEVSWTVDCVGLADSGLLIALTLGSRPQGQQLFRRHFYHADCRSIWKKVSRQISSLLLPQVYYSPPIGQIIESSPESTKRAVHYAVCEMNCKIILQNVDVKRNKEMNILIQYTMNAQFNF